MKKILLILALLSTVNAYADNVSDLMGLGMPGALASEVNAQYSTAIAESQIPAATNTVDLGSASKVYKASYLGAATATTLNATGLSSLDGQVALGFEEVAGAGTTVADAAALSAAKGVHRITGANGTVGWKFVTATPIGSVQILLNTTAGVAKVYAESGGTINGASADAAFSALTGIKPIICVKTAAATYLCA